MTTTTRPPYAPGERVRFMFSDGKGIALTNGAVTAVTEREPYYPHSPRSWEVSARATGGDVERSFFVPDSGRSDYLERGWFDRCNLCDAAVNVRDGSGTWNARDEVVCRGGCPVPEAADVDPDYWYGIDSEGTLWSAAYVPAGEPYDETGHTWERAVVRFSVGHDTTDPDWFVGFRDAAPLTADRGRPVEFSSLRQQLTMPTATADEVRRWLTATHPAETGGA